MKFYILLSLMGVAGVAFSLQCFSCNSETDSACSDDFKDDSAALRAAFITTCPDKEGVVPFCRKVKYAIERVQNTSEHRVQRDCGERRREGADCYQKRSEDYVMDTCQCDGDLCNGAPTVVTSVSTLLAVTVPIFARFL